MKLKKVKRSFMFPLALIFTASWLTCFQPSSLAAESEIQIEIIGDYIKSILSDTDENEFHRLIEQHYKILQLIDSNDNWVHPKLEAISNDLLPTDFDGDQAKDFVDEMIAANEKNPYLMHFLESTKGMKFSVLEERFEAEKDEVIPDAIAYGYVLNALAKASYDDWKILEVLDDVFTTAIEKVDLRKELGITVAIKMPSIATPVKYALDFFRENKVDENFAKSLLPLNIFESTMFDLTQGYFGNARTGLALTANGPNSNGNLGSAPAHFSDSGNAVHVVPPLPLEWANLYQTWNMAFIAQFPDFPYTITKLLIPQVSDYQDEPDGFLFTRVIALYVSMSSYCLQTQYKNDKPLKARINWVDRDLVSFWGDKNRESTYDYEDKLVEQDPWWIGAFSSFGKRFEAIKK